MRILTSVLGVFGAVAAVYLGLYAGMISGESSIVAPADTLLLASPLLAAAGAIAVWLWPAIARVALWAALITWLMFGVAVAGLGAGAIEDRHVLGLGLLMILPAALLAGAAYATGRLCRQLAASSR